MRRLVHIADFAEDPAQGNGLLWGCRMAASPVMECLLMRGKAGASVLWIGVTPCHGRRLAWRDTRDIHVVMFRMVPHGVSSDVIRPSGREHEKDHGPIVLGNALEWRAPVPRPAPARQYEQRDATICAMIDAGPPAGLAGASAGAVHPRAARGRR
jgi:hypothetical protein